METFQLLHGGCLWQRWRVDELNLLHVVDEQVETRLAPAAGRSYPVSRPHGPHHRYSPSDDRAAEGDIDDHDDPTVWVVAPECHEGRRDVDDADDEEKYRQENKVVGMGICLHVTPPAK